MKSGMYGDKELIRLCLEGQDKGYTMLYERYSVPVYNTISRLVNHHTAEAEDLLQEAFVAVFSGMERLRDVENFEAWIRRVAINLSISHLRKQKLRFLEIDEEKQGEIADQGQEDVLWKESRLEDIERAIDSLPETGRTIVNLFLFEEMSQEEIGKLLGMSHVAVRSQYHRAKNRIASLVRQEVSYEK